MMRLAKWRISAQERSCSETSGQGAENIGETGQHATVTGSRDQGVFNGRKKDDTVEIEVTGLDRRGGSVSGGRCLLVEDAERRGAW